MLSVSPINTSSAKGLSAYYAEKLERGEISRDEALELSEGDFDFGDLQEGRTKGAARYYASEKRDRLVNVSTGESVSQDDLLNHLLGKDIEGNSLTDPGLLATQKLAKSVGYDGELNSFSLSALRSGLHPETGQDLGDEFRQRWEEKASKTSEVSSYDLTFSAPKGVSVIAAYSDSETRERIVQLHNEAIREALGWAEEEGIFVARRGKDGVETVAASPVQTFGKTEFSSRAGDPHLHGHTLISAAAQTEDGRRTTLSGTHIFNGAALVGTTYEQRLAHKLNREFGLDFYTKDNGLREVWGFDEATLQAHSQRSQQIAERLDEMTAADDLLRRKVEGNLHEYERSYGLVSSGETVPRVVKQQAAEYEKYLQILQGKSNAKGNRNARQAANLASRVGKEESEAESFERWKQENPYGKKNVIDEVQKEAKVQQELAEAKRKRDNIEKLEGVEKILKDVVSDRSSFTMKELYKATIANADPNMTPKQIEGLFAAALNDDRVLALTDYQDQKLGDWVFTKQNQVLTTSDALAQEQNIRDISERLTTENRHNPMNLKKVLDAAERANLTPEQEDMLAAATLSKNSLTVVQAPAGAGKTYSLAPVVELHQREGYEVVGLATAARTADSLKEANVNRSMSLARFAYAMEKGYWEEGLSNDEIAEVRKFQARVQNKERHAEEDLQSLLKSLDEAHPNLSDEFAKLKRDRAAAKKLNPGPKRDERFKELSERGDGLARRANATKVKKDEKVLLVLDEAAMTNNDDLENVLRNADERGWKVILVGDERQLQGIGKSTGFQVVAKQAGAVELTTTYRAKDSKERDLQEAWWRSDNTKQGQAAVDEYLEYQDEKDCLHIIEDEHVQQWMEAHEGEELPRDVGKKIAVEAIAEQYVEAINAGQEPSELLAMAATRADSRALGEAIQKRLVEAGHLDADTAHEVILDKKTNTVGVLHQGEQVRLTRNNQPKIGESEKFQNGWTGTMVGWNRDGSARVLLPAGPGGAEKVVTIPTTAIEDGVLTYGASTAHAAQGRTVDKAWLLADERMEREALYPGMTRGKTENHLVYVPSAGASKEEAREAIREQALTSGKDAPALDRAATRVSPADERKARRILRFGVSDEEVKAVALQEKQRQAEAQERQRSKSRASTEQAQEALREEKQRRVEQQERKRGRGRGLAA
ncbi:MobF family relaxase [Gordonia sp. (in: high G+C Gram-positive bacteria)]|uniref:MobF family relaxase n=1 Tax=Gordonia sp. (in: high G+C Gram-positive bacteria) TaxID=84139 RepID=UPI003F94CC9B